MKAISGSLASLQDALLHRGFPEVSPVKRVQPPLLLPTRRIGFIAVTEGVSLSFLGNETQELILW